jgi:hypothetical protein
MTRRSMWALYRHGWHLPGMAFVFGLLIGLYLYASGSSTAVAAATPVAAAMLTAGVIVPLSVLTSMVIRRQMMCSSASRWMAHWCEGPDGQLAVRMTRPEPATEASPAYWPGRDLFGGGGAGRRLLVWLQHLAEEHHAVVIIKTTRPKLLIYYQSIGFSVVKPPRIRIGTAWQLGTAVLRYPPEQPGR